MFLAFYFVVVGVLAFVPPTHAEICGDYNVCLPDDYQEAYCCGLGNQNCCYYTDVVGLWWFWLLLVFFILFFGVCCSAIWRHRRRSRLGYVVIRGETSAPTGTTIVHTQNSHVTTAGPAYTQYYGGAPPPAQGYTASAPPAPQGYKASAPPPYGIPFAQPPPMYQG